VSSISAPAGAAAGQLGEPQRQALAELLEAMADDEFVLGFWDSEWTGIAPLLEEDVAFSSLAQDEIGHARALYQLLADLTGGDPDRIAFGREPQRYRHARLLDHPRTDWAFSIARRFLYDTADAARLDLLAASAYAPLRDLVAKMRREETYHLLHMSLWVERLASAGAGQEPRVRLSDALELLWPDALCVLAPLPGEPRLIEAGVLAESLAVAEQRWLGGLEPLLERLELPFPFRREGDRLEPTIPRPPSPRSDHAESFQWLWGEFTMVYRSDPEASW
jgi:ring-1,2-phenylacetyl-CoA epoxidase subunit PaaC